MRNENCYIIKQGKVFKNSAQPETVGLRRDILLVRGLFPSITSFREINNFQISSTQIKFLLYVELKAKYIIVNHRKHISGEISPIEQMYVQLQIHRRKMAKSTAIIDL